MKPLPFTAITFFFFFIVFFLTLSHGFHLETPLFRDLTQIVSLKPDHHHHHDVRPESSSSDGTESKILLPTEKPLEADDDDVIIPMAEMFSDKRSPAEESEIKIPATTELDLRRIINRHRLRNRFPIHVFRSFPNHRCRHHHNHHRFFPHLSRFSRIDQNDVDLMMLKKNKVEKVREGIRRFVDREPYANIRQHHSFVRKFPEAEDHGDEGMMMMRFGEFKHPHHYMFHHHHDHHHDDDDDDNQDKRGMKKHKDQHDHDRDDEHEVRENEILKKIRKFLAHF